jgi:hypothetical protein
VKYRTVCDKLNPRPSVGLAPLGAYVLGMNHFNNRWSVPRFGMRFDGLLRVKAMGTLPHTSGRPVAAIQERHSPEEVPRKGECQQCKCTHHWRWQRLILLSVPRDDNRHIREGEEAHLPAEPRLRLPTNEMRT